MSLVLVIPAHNEEAQILETLASVTAQTVQPDRTIVLCDNCTDNTGMLAAEAGFEVWHSRNNAGKKGGALNQAYERLADDLEVSDYFATMDADTILDSHFIARALEKFDQNPGTGGVCATFEPKSLDKKLKIAKTPVLALAQTMEYARFCRAVGRRKGSPNCLAGAAAVYAVEALHAIVQQRGHLYAPVLTEDYELTLAIRTRGWKIFAPKVCRAQTEIMPTVRTLYHQRTRWYVGTIAELRKYGWSKYTRRDILMQFWTAGTVAMRYFFFATLITTYLVAGALTFAWWAFIPLLLFGSTRAVEAGRLGWKYSALAFFMFEEIYLIMLEAIFVISACQALFGSREIRWVHLVEKRASEQRIPALEVT